MTDLQADSGLLASILDAAADACVVLDGGMRIVYANSAAASALGQASLLGRRLAELVPRHGAACESRLAGAAAVAFDSPLVAPGRTYELRGSGVAAGLAVFIRDVTEERQMAASLATADDRNRALMRQSPIPIQIIRSDGATSWLNPAFTRLWGATLEDLAGYCAFEDPQAIELGIVDFLRRAFAGEVVRSPRIRYDGGRVRSGLPAREVRATAYPYLDVAGEVTEVALLYEDVSDAFEAREIIRQQEAELRTVLEAVGAGRWEQDVRTGEMRWSPELYRLFGLDPSEAPRLERFLELIHPADRDRAQQAARQAIATVGGFNFEFRLALPDGRERWIASVGRAFAGPDGRTARLVGLNFDITERLQARAALERTERSLALAMKGGRMGYWTRELGDDGLRTSDRVEWSPELEAVFGLAPGTFEGTEGGFFAFVHPDDIEILSRAVAESIESGTDYAVPFRFRHADGTWHWMEGRGRATYDAAGRPTRLDGIGIDITAQKRAEQSLRMLVELSEATRTEEDPREIVRATERILREYLAANRCAYAEVEEDNDHFTVEMDDCRECVSIVGRYPLSAFGPRALQELREGKAYVVDDIETDPDRPEDLTAYRETQIRAVVCVSLVKEGRMTALMAVHQREPRAWTEEEIRLVSMVADRCWSHIARARANRRLAVSESQYREIAASLPQLVWTARPDGQVDYCNRRWYDYIGAGHDPLGDGWSTTIHPDDLAATRIAWSRALATGEPATMEHRIRSADGTYRWHLVRAVPLRDAEGRIVRWFGTNTDIQAHVEQTEELERRVAERTYELETANRELQGFTYTVSHDLRSPLRAIMASSMILLEEAGARLDPDERELLARQAHNARRLGLLIDELLEFSRIGRQELRRSRLDIAELAREVAAEIREERRTVPNLEIAERLPAEGDPTMLRLVLRNLLENACKFSPEGGTVSVGSADGVFYVRDQGIGFDPAYAHKLFLPFERLVSESEFPGTGIGLANVKRIVERHGGMVWAEGRPGAGATFYFTLS